MASTITLPQLIELLAKKDSIAGCGNIETTTSAFFESIADALRTDRIVKIKNFGSFAISDDDCQKLSFIPCEEIEKAVNAPFEFFEPVELGENVTDEMLAEADSPTTPTAETADEIAETTPDNKISEESISEEITEPEIPSTDKTEPCIEQFAEHDRTENKNEETRTNTDTDKKIIYIYKNVFPWWYALLGGIAAGCIIGVFLLFLIPAYYTADVNGQEYEIVVSDTLPVPVATVETDKDTLQIEEETAEEITATGKPANNVITDTVSSRRFLTTMARQYYGEMAFWAYIYIENSDKLGNPDRIAPNTVVVIPPAEKYNIDKKNPKSIDDAKQKGLEIYSKYR